MTKSFEAGVKCHTCYHADACEAWIRHGTTLYDDYSFSTEGCPYYVHSADVIPTTHGRWIEAEDGDGVVCSECGTDFCTLFYRREDLKHCICGAKMDL